MDPSLAAAAAPPASFDSPPARKPSSSAGGRTAPVTSIPAAPCTAALPPPGPELADLLPAPHVPRANAAVSAQKPGGEPAPSPAEAAMTVLQRHCAFFDPDGDGVIWAGDTFRGFHKIGLNFLLSLVAVLVIHGTFSFWTSPSLGAFLLNLPRGAPVHLGKIDRGLHGSDSRTYDTEGRFRPEEFEEIFSKHGARADEVGKGGWRGAAIAAGGGERGGGVSPADGTAVLTWPAILRMLARNRSIGDPIGMTAAFLEWGALYWLAADHERGFLTKEDVRAMYDGSLWPRLAERTAQRRAGGGGGAGRPHAA